MVVHVHLQKMQKAFVRCLFSLILDISINAKIVTDDVVWIYKFKSKFHVNYAKLYFMCICRSLF